LGIVILICGGLIGAGVTAHVFWERFLRAAHSPEDAPARIVERMAGRLDLTDEQARWNERMESLKERWMRRGPGRLLGPPGRGSLRRGR
jgi:hypothetical protein